MKVTERRDGGEETAAVAALDAARQRLDSLPGAGDRARRRIELLERRDTVAITELERADRDLRSAISAVEAAEVAGVLERFSRFAPVAQIIVVSNRPAFVEWAASVGPDRAGVAAA